MVIKTKLNSISAPENPRQKLQSRVAQCNHLTPHLRDTWAEHLNGGRIDWLLLRTTLDRVAKNTERHGSNSGVRTVQ